ncbi:hypothetical protein M406DRAFT_276198 [Cryphonectria parasitica EP155]|uniref:Adhesin domain-containing protein n=1 Tax=Cryphonectria parasitica (strain ATCC 38755 / EP155) TaxID=660469 RepID=A0A9P4Y367_CRYP1|nr:uncharacterized protein M406DRAFT_276198 [Cryphonectria parasitica EP155]KAF3765522.1 hypothetical protein M406DRAFT_276198 [Cryphonectria parasitica EP155]
MCAPKVAKSQNVELRLDFSASRNISVFQDIKDDYAHDGKDVHISGDVIIRRSGAGTPGPSIKVQTIVNDRSLKLELDWDDDEQRLKIWTPRSISWSDSLSSPCAVVQATIWVPADSILDKLSVETVHLGVKLLDNLSLQLRGSTRLASTVGSVVAATDGVKDKADLMHNAPPTTFNLDTRNVEIKTISGNIMGSWPLYDYLGLETISGSIHAGVRPKDALKDRPRPAILYAKSISGNIEVYEPITEATATRALQEKGASIASGPEDLIPPRSYGVDLQSMSGTVKASVAFGTSFKTHTTSGKMDLTLLPVLDQTQALDTSSTSGDTTVGVLEQPGQPILPTGAAHMNSPPLRVLSGKHTATSARIRVTYPSSWEGFIDADTLSGKINVGGEGVEIIRRREDGFPGIKKAVLAHKGSIEKGGGIKAHTTSGDIRVAIGSL